jgi:Fructose-bisphosphate aldolase class-I
VFLIGANPPRLPRQLGPLRRGAFAARRAGPGGLPVPARARLAPLSPRDPALGARWASGGPVTNTSSSTHQWSALISTQRYFTDLTSAGQAAVSRARTSMALDDSFTFFRAFRLESIGVENTEDNRRSHRELLVTTPGLGDYISVAILFEEAPLAMMPFLQIGCEPCGRCWLQR